MISKRLLRQLRKSLDLESPEIFGELAAYVAALPASAERDRLRAVLTEMPDFLAAVDGAHAQVEDQLQLSRRSLELSSHELMQVNGNISAMLNSLGQGFLMFDARGKCAAIHSKVCEQLLECNPEGMDILDVLRVPAERRATLLGWIELLFLGVHDFEDLAPVGPRAFPHSKGLCVELAFKPIHDADGALAYVVMIATDRTDEVRLREESRKTQEMANMVACILRDKNQFLSFLRYKDETVRMILELAEGSTFTDAEMSEAKNTLHTLKGTAGSFGFVSEQALIHETETALAAGKSAVDIQANLRAFVQRLTKIHEETIRANRVIFEWVHSAQGPVRENQIEELTAFESWLAERGEHEIAAQFADRFVAVPAVQAFRRFQSLLDDTCRGLGKLAPELSIDGGGLRIVPERLDRLLNMLVHIFANIAVHGIECAEERLNAGKRPGARVEIRLAVEAVAGAPGLRLEIGDDGRGIDPEGIRRKLRSLGRAAEAETLTEGALRDCIFESGFSTAKSADKLSGRGVGMSALKEEVEAMGGSIAVDSVVGQGTRFTILVPYATARQLRAA